MRHADRKDFPHFLELPTRWIDNDQYGHVNNVQYYSYFDTTVNRLLIQHGVLDIHTDQIVGFVVDSGCAYFSSISFPDLLHIGLRVARIGNSSVRYELAIFPNDALVPAAAGHFVHVYVDRSSNKAVALPPAVRTLLETLELPHSVP